MIAEVDLEDSTVIDLSSHLAMTMTDPTTLAEF